jgi:hypothetical protein
VQPPMRELRTKGEEQAQEVEPLRRGRRVPEVEVQVSRGRQPRLGSCWT